MYVVPIGSIRATHRVGYSIGGVFVPHVGHRCSWRMHPRLWVALRFHRGVIVDNCDDGRLTVWYRRMRFIRVHPPLGWRCVASQLRRDWWTR